MRIRQKSPQLKRICNFSTVKTQERSGELEIRCSKLEESNISTSREKIFDCSQSIVEDRRQPSSKFVDNDRPTC